MAIFVSAEQTITSGGSLTIAHGLGATPNLVDFYLVCKASLGDSGWSLGDIIRPIQPANTVSGGAGQGCVVTVDSSNLNVRFGSGNQVFAACQNSPNINGAYGSVGLTNANWHVVFVAETTSGYTSADQTITKGGSFTLSHGLGARPKAVYVALVCQTAEHGYSAGDIVFNLNATGTTVSSGVAMQATSSQLTGKYYNAGSTSTVFQAIDKSTGAGVRLTDANWKMRVFAYDGSGSENSSSIVSAGTPSTIFGSTAHYIADEYECTATNGGYAIGAFVHFKWFYQAGLLTQGASLRRGNGGRFSTDSGSGLSKSVIAGLDTTGAPFYLGDNDWLLYGYTE